jgi:hypothetical protein
VLGGLILELELGSFVGWHTVSKYLLNGEIP